MKTIALVTADSSLQNDFDMVPLLAACRGLGLRIDIRAWHDPAVDWSCYCAVVLRSTWDYADRLPQFLTWCEQVSAVTELFNPLAAIRWSLDKHYLSDLAANGVPVVPTHFVEAGMSPLTAVQDLLAAFREANDFVVKPAIGCYSKDVQRFGRSQAAEAAAYIARLVDNGASAVLQPYLPAIDEVGETNLIFFDGVYSHSICKGALLAPDGSVNVPSFDFRSPRDACEDERAVALAALETAAALLQLDRPLLYARVDLIRGWNNDPRVLELEIAEPSLSLPLAEHGAERFAEVLSTLAKIEQDA